MCVLCMSSWSVTLTVVKTHVQQSKTKQNKTKKERQNYAKKYICKNTKLGSQGSTLIVGQVKSVASSHSA